MEGMIKFRKSSASGYVCAYSKPTDQFSSKNRTVASSKAAGGTRLPLGGQGSKRRRRRGYRRRSSPSPTD